MQDSGQPGDGRRRYRGADKAGQPGELANRHRRRMRGSRRLETPSPVKPEMQDLGRPGDSSEALRRKWRNGATRARRKPAARKDARFGATRRPFAGTAKGLKIRGNPENRRRRGRLGAEYGATRRRKPGQAGRCRGEATRNLIAKLNGACGRAVRRTNSAGQRVRARRSSAMRIFCARPAAQGGRAGAAPDAEARDVPGYRPGWPPRFRLLWQSRLNSRPRRGLRRDQLESGIRAISPNAVVFGAGAAALSLGGCPK